MDAVEGRVQETPPPAPQPEPTPQGAGPIRIHFPFLLLIVAYAAAAYWADVPVRLGLFGVIGLSGGLYLLSMLALVTRLRWELRFRRREGGPLESDEAWEETWRELRGEWLTWRRTGAFLMAMAASTLFMNVFGSWKRAIPELRPFSWDAALSRMDALLHMGHQPWMWLHPLLENPPVTVAIDVAYSLWPSVLLGVLIWQAWSQRVRLRARFFLAYGLTWVLLGTAAALFFSSAGPAYYAQVTGQPGPYQPLFAYLAEVDGRYGLDALSHQAHLWAIHTGESSALGDGIAAMPDLHLATMILFALLAGYTSRWLAWAFGLYAVVIFVGSVHLGWHYAVDGYVSAVAVPPIWWLSGQLIVLYERLAGRLAPRPQTRTDAPAVAGRSNG